MLNRRLLPNLISFSSLFCGFWSILLAGQGHYMTAAWLIVIAAIFDGLDGAVARLIHSPSKYGVELDSLVDIVSFGVAPAVLLYNVVLQPLGFAGVLFAFLPLLAGLLRLVRFNIMNSEPSQKKGDFMGMPITSAGIVLASFYAYQNAWQGITADQHIYLALIAIVSLLMVSPIPYKPLPVLRVGSKPIIPITVMVIGAAAIVIDPAKAIFPIMTIYLFTGPVGWAFAHIRKVKAISEEDEEDEEIDGQRAATPKRHHHRRKGGRL